MSRVTLLVTFFSLHKYQQVKHMKAEESWIACLVITDGHSIHPTTMHMDLCEYQLTHNHLPIHFQTGLGLGSGLLNGTQSQ